MSNGISRLFSSFGTGNQTSMNFSSNMLSDYYSVRNGSYKKLMRAYYEKIGKADTKSANTSKTSHTDKAEKTTNRVKQAGIVTTSAKLTEMKSTSSDLMTRASKLLDKGKTSLFKKVEKTDSEGNQTKEYDTEKIYSAVKDYVDAYNKTLESTGSSTVSTIRDAVSRMTSNTKTNEKMLNSIGIHIDKDTNQLSVNKDTFQATDMNKVKSLFNDAGSYGYYITTKASRVNASATYEATKTNTYTNTGSYTSSLSAGNLYDSIF